MLEGDSNGIVLDDIGQMTALIVSGNRGTQVYIQMMCLVLRWLMGGSFEVHHKHLRKVDIVASVVYFC